MNNESTPLAALIAALFGGQQQQEQITYNAHTQVWVPVLQFLGVIFSALAILTGLALLGTGFYWTAGQLTATADRLLVSALIVTGSLILRLVERAGIARLNLNPTPWRTLTGFLIRVALVAALLDLVYYLTATWTARQTWAILGGLALLPAGGLLAWRFVNELWNPLYPRSPWAALVERAFGAFTGPEPETVEVLRPYPVTLNGNLTTAHWQDDDEEDEPAATDIDPQFRDLIAFLELAQRHGLARDDSASQKGLVTHPRRRLPSGRRLTRPAYDELTALAADVWKILEKEDKTWKWRMDPEKAIDLLTTVLTQVPAPRQAPRQAGSQGPQYRTAGPSVGERVASEAKQSMTRRNP